MNRRLELAKMMVALAKTGTPIRHARGVIVSSTIGQSQVTIDGGATQIPAFNYAHTQLLPSGTVVDVLAVGKKAYVVGSYDGDVSIGGFVGSKTGPASQTDYSTVATVFTLAVSLVNGHKYEISLKTEGQQITNASSLIQVYVSDSLGLIPTTYLKAGMGSAAASEYFACGSTEIITATSTATDTFTVSVSSNAAAYRVAANAIEFHIIRVA